MFKNLTQDAHEFSTWSWDQIQPYADNLRERPLSADNVGQWLADWTQLASLIEEVFNRLQVVTTTDTSDEENRERFNQYAEQIMPQAREFEQHLKEKLLATGLEPDGFAVPLRKMRVEAEIFRAENLPLQTEIDKLGTELSKISGSRTIEWDGEELTLQQTWAHLLDPDRAARERAWRLGMDRVMQDRDQINEIGVQLLDLRLRMAENAGFSTYRDFRWQELGRFDYTPDDCKAFHAAIEEVVVPVVARLNERRKARMGLDTLCVWDDFWFQSPDALGRPAIRPYETLDELNDRIEAIFHRVDPELGGYYHTMREENLLDLESRKHKSGGGYMTEFPVAKRPFIFMNAVGIHGDVQTLLHEGGHAFHYFEAVHLPYYHQRMGQTPMEFIEVPSMAMELLAAPYLAADQSGFYSEAEAARARVEHLERMLKFWPYMAVVDAFQHWIYENPGDARDPRRCDATWFSLHRRYMPGYDWSGIEGDLELYWRLQGHILSEPFYYIEYGFSQLGAAQVWANALQDQAAAVRAYRRALQLGNTVSLPELYQAAGATFAFDADTLRQSVDLIEATINELDPV